MIKDKSFLRKPPINLDPKQVIVLNAMSFSVDICEIAFNQLEEDLLKFSNNPKSEGLIFPKIFSNVWTIINNASVFRNLIVRHFKISHNEPTLSEFNKAKKIRNTNQHIDERIEEVLSLKVLPIYGSLSWYRNIENSNKVEQFFLFSGTFENPDEVEGEMILPNLEKTGKAIEHMIFRSVTKQGNNDFPELTISLNEIMEDLKLWVEHFEKLINDLVHDKENIKQHKSNLFIKINSHWK